MYQEEFMDEREKHKLSQILEEEEEANKRQWIGQTIQIQTIVTLPTFNLH